MREGCVPWPASFAAAYRAQGYWNGDVLGRLPASMPDADTRSAVVTRDRELTYGQLARAADRLAAGLVYGAAAGQGRRRVTPDHQSDRGTAQGCQRPGRLVRDRGAHAVAEEHQGALRPGALFADEVGADPGDECAHVTGGLFAVAVLATRVLDRAHLDVPRRVQRPQPVAARGSPGVREAHEAGPGLGAGGRGAQTGHNSPSS
jgi:hypothetical protein